jgi:hypothetical protein
MICVCDVLEKASDKFGVKLVLAKLPDACSRATVFSANFSNFVPLSLLLHFLFLPSLTLIILYLTLSATDASLALVDAWGVDFSLRDFQS